MDRPRDSSTEPTFQPVCRSFLSRFVFIRCVGQAGATGLDYAGCMAACRALKMDWGAVLPGLQMMEDEALTIWSE